MLTGCKKGEDLLLQKLPKKRKGFNLLEVVIAISVLFIITLSALLLSTFSATSLKDSEARDMAKNIATFVVEFVRSRNVTMDNNFLGILPPTDPSFSTASSNDKRSKYWFDPDLNPNAYFPGLVDLGANPLLTNPEPLRPNTSSDTINIHPALPDVSYNSNSFYSSLQGFVSFSNNPVNSSPSQEDGNAFTNNGKYYDLITTAPYVVQFPEGINNFSAFANYNALIFTTDSDKVNTNSAVFDPHYTNEVSKKIATMSYRGFRVLTQIVARKKDASSPNHVQYYDVKVTVFWIVGSYEHSYSLSTKVTTY
ncbi:MAG: type II secretion system GspH family protein [Caldisericaceae bacterium]